MGSASPFYPHVMPDFFVIPDLFRNGITILQLKNFYVYYRNVIAKSERNFRHCENPVRGRSNLQSLKKEPI